MLARIGSLVTATALAASFSAPAAECPTERPNLTGPSIVQIGQTYSVAWTNVLPQTGANDYYLLQRSSDPGFAGAVDQIKTTRAAQTFPRVSGESTLYHRVVVTTSCPAASPALLVSNTLKIRFTSDCDSPSSPGEITVTPPEPPAFTTYVLTWDVGVGGPGPGGAPANITYRLRRTSPVDVRESLATTGTASFSDAPGTYVYQVRAETSCGNVGPWSAAKIVQVGTTPVTALAVVTQPTPIAALDPASPPQTQFAVRNTGSVALSVTASSPHVLVTVTPASFSLAPYQTQTLTVTYNSLNATASPYHGKVELSAAGTELEVPIDVAIGKSAPASPVNWSDTDADIDAAGGGVLRSIANSGSVPATVVSAVNAPWLLVEPVDGSAWDRPLAPGEVRLVRLRVDRTRRKSETGTEVAAVTLVTAGSPDEPQVLQVVDDGPPLSVLTGPRPDATGAQTRLLYASLPNARDAMNVGLYSSDLWLANVDPLTSVDVSLHLTPLGNDSRTITYSFSTRLAPGETRRYRNIVAKVLGVEGACELEVRSPAPTLNATALVNNTPLSPIARGALGAPGPLSSTPTGQYGFEMRPTRPGEGVSVKDQKFVLSGILQSAARRTNILLTETSGYETTVRLSLFDRGGFPVTKDGQDVVLPVRVPALGTVDLQSDRDLFGPGASFPGALYAIVEFVTGTPDGFGNVHGSVVPFATVIDNVTQDASLRVGVSTGALDPNGAAGTVSRPAPLGNVPFAGGASPLLFPVVHAIGAPLGSGNLPYWRTRVTFTNTTDRQTGEDRALRLTFYDVSPGAPAEPRHVPIPLQAGGTFTIDDLLGSSLGFGIPESVGAYGAVQVEVASDGEFTWKDVDVETETYTVDPNWTTGARGQYATGMEGFSYRHGYSSYQSNLGTVQIDGAETSSRYRTNLILQEVGGASCQVAISAYLRGSFVPIETKAVTLPPFGYLSRELFRGWLGLDLKEMTEVRVVVRQIDGDGVFMAFASKINLSSGDPANIFLRPALAGTGR